MLVPWRVFLGSIPANTGSVVVDSKGLVQTVMMIFPIYGFQVEFPSK